MKLDIVHFDAYGDGVIAIYINDKLYTYGDEYHDRMSNWITGFLDGLKYAEVDFVENRLEVCYAKHNTRFLKKIVEQGQSPPDDLKDIKW